MVVGIPKESLVGERRVALVPADVQALEMAGVSVQVETGAGVTSHFTDVMYIEKGAKIVQDRKGLFRTSDVILQVMAAAANPVGGVSDLKLMSEGQFLIGFLDPYRRPEVFSVLMKHKITSFALELIPRITKAQSMDALSSMASISGYKAVLMAAEALSRMFPMLITPAGTVLPARVLVIGAGVAGLQAIATAHRMGAVVKAYDIRPAVKEQVLSLGAKFVELKLQADGAETEGGYAREMGDDFYKRQRELLAREIADSDVLITTAAVPGRKAPVLVTEEMVNGMRHGSVIVDLAVERGGNCELTKSGERLEYSGVTIIGPVNLPSTVPHHASQLYSHNICTFLMSLLEKGNVEISPDNEIVRATMVTDRGKLVHEDIGKALNL
jgi:NAD(P) transhydrogenase subunit alpha